MNTGASDYVCNSKDRFDLNSYYKLEELEYLFAGGQCLPIYGYGSVTLSVTDSLGLALFKLLEVAYVPDLFTSCVTHC